MMNAEGEPPLTPFTPQHHLSPTAKGISSFTDDEGPFQEVMSKGTKRSRRESIGEDTNIVVPPSRTVLFAPNAVGGNVRNINKQVLSEHLDSIAPGQVAEARVNVRKNVIAVDTTTPSAVHVLLATTALCGVPVRAFLPRPPNTRAGVIRDVDASITDTKILSLCYSGVKIVEARRFGSTTTVQLLFEGDTIPAHVKLGLVRYSVQPYTPRPLQCHLCHRIGHVAGSCLNAACCPKCAGQHTEANCTSPTPKCINCSKPHMASSLSCPRLQREREICKAKERGRLTFAEAAKEVNAMKEKDFPPLEAHLTKYPSVAPVSSESANITQAKPPHSAGANPLPAPSPARVMTSQSPCHAKRNVRAPAASIPTEMASATFSLGQAICAFVQGLRLLLSQLSYEWAPFIVRVLDFAEPLLRGFC